MKPYLLIALLVVVACCKNSGAQDESQVSKLKFDLRLRSMKSTELDATKYQYSFRNEEWLPAETAIIVCDFWDYHHCLNAVNRMKEFGPRLNQVVEFAREQGATIIHSPSGCMDAYAQHPARKRAVAVPQKNLPQDVAAWCSQIPAEELATYPIDQSDGGEDDDPTEHKKWAEQLEALGRNPNLPWKKQSDMVPIDGEKDFISDRGDEVWSILQQQKIKNVILVGVHTNMCVLGRPFGLRQMKRLGFNVVLMRDMTDSMYNPKRWPFVSHYAGHDRVIAHVEKFVCPTISSEQLIGGREFHFQSDPRPHLAIVIGESEYKTNQTLPHFAEKHLAAFRTTFILANPADRNDFPDIKKIQDADLMLLSVRRRVLKPEQMKLFKEFEAAKKPIIGIRTASHAFSLRNSAPPEGYEDWKSFDSEVFGGNYTNHYGNKLKSIVSFTEKAASHPITKSIATDAGSRLPGEDANLKSFGQNGSLYKTSPLSQGAEVLVTGKVLGQPAEPVAWAFERVNKGKSFYTSLGHPLDFGNSNFTSLLSQAIHWSAGSEATDPASTGKKKFWRVMEAIRLPENEKLLDFKIELVGKEAGQLHAYLAFRKVVRFTGSWADSESIKVVTGAAAEKAWLNGTPLKAEVKGQNRIFHVANDLIEKGDANWLVLGVKLKEGEKKNGSLDVVVTSKEKSKKLTGDWEWVQGSKDFKDAAKIYLPAKFGGSPRIFMEVGREKE